VLIFSKKVAKFEIKYKNRAGRNASDEEKLFNDRAMKILIIATKNSMI